MLRQSDDGHLFMDFMICLCFTDDHLLITSLRPNTHYNVVVEARRLQKYSEIDEGR